MKQVPSDFGGTRNGMVVHWPKGIKAKNEIRTQFSHVIDVAPTILQAAGLPEPKVVNGAADPDGGHQPGLHLRRRQGEGAPHHAVLRDRRQPRHLPRRLVRAHDPQGALGGQAAPRAAGQLGWELYDTRTDFSLANDLAAKNPQKLAELQAVFMKEAGRKYTCCRWTTASSSARCRGRRPPRPDGRPHVADAGRGHDRA
jgi:arylsulfatase A-like enzyme